MVRLGSLECIDVLHRKMPLKENNLTFYSLSRWRWGCERKRDMGRPGQTSTLMCILLWKISASTFLSGKKDPLLLGISWIFHANREATSQNFRSGANCTCPRVPRGKAFSPVVLVGSYRGTIKITKMLPAESCRRERRSPLWQTTHVARNFSNTIG